MDKGLCVKEVRMYQWAVITYEAYLGVYYVRAQIRSSVRKNVGSEKAHERVEGMKEK